MRPVVVLLFVALVAVAGCASSAPPPRPAVRPFAHVRQIAVVVSGESRFAVLGDNAEPGRTFDEILKWGFWGADGLWMRPLAQLVHQGINWLLDTDRAAETRVDLGNVAPRSVMAAAFVRALEASGQFAEIRPYGGEPLGDDRRRADAIVRVSLPTWGLVRVREDDPDFVSAFADVRLEIAVPVSGVTLWADSQDVTDTERVPLQAFKADREFARRQLTALLERAGRRAASELLYARGLER